jgi:hypothetical protein
MRFQDWGWALINGCVTLLLGIIINRQLPEASLVGMADPCEQGRSGATNGASSHAAQQP